MCFPRGHDTSIGRRPNELRTAPAALIGGIIPPLETDMRRHRLVTVSAIVLVVLLAGVRAADVTGTWSATFDSQVGPQQYTYQFTVQGSELTGTAKGSLTGEAKI